MKDDLKQNVADLAKVTNDKWQKVVQNFYRRMKAYFNRNECHIEHADYKKFL